MMFPPKSYHSVSKIIVNEFRLILEILMELIRILIPPKPHAGNCAVQSWADNRDIVYWFIQGIYRFSFCDILFDDCFLFVY